MLSTTEGLKGLWFPWSGPTGLTLRDKSGHDNHGTLTSMVPSTDWVMSEKGWALEFDGSTNYVDCGNNTSLNMADELSFGGWIFRTTTARTTPFGKFFREYDCFLEASATPKFFVYFGDGTLFTAVNWNPSPTFLNAWHHILVTIKKSTGVVNAWFDGIQQTEKSGTARGAGGTNGFHIGRRVGGANDFGGLIGPVYVYDRILSGDDIQQHFVDPWYPLVLPTPIPPPISVSTDNTLAGQLSIHPTYTFDSIKAGNRMEVAELSAQPRISLNSIEI